MRHADPNIVCICQIDSQILVFCGNRLKILGFFDSRFFGSPRQINELGDSLLIGPDISCADTSKTTRFRFENDSIFDLVETIGEFLLDFFVRF